MGRPRSIPSYRRHKQSGQAIVTLVDAVSGRRKDFLLGEHGTQDSKIEYARLIQQWEAAGGRMLDERTDDLTISELILAYMDRHVMQHYRDADGNLTYDARIGVRISLKPLKQLFGHERAADFGPLRLKAVRERMIGEGLSRRTINTRVWRIVKMFKWAAENELVPASVYHGLQAVSGLQRGRSPAPDRAPIKPVDEARVNATLPFLPPPVAAMVRLQRYTGMRPGEVVIMRPCDIDRSDKLWFYRPSHHKNAWRAKERLIALGPKAKLVLLPYLNRDAETYCFSPAEAVLHILRDRRERRKTKVQPSQTDRSKDNPKRRPGDRYDTQSYGRAIDRACDQAFPPPQPLAKCSGETHEEWNARLTDGQKAELIVWRISHRWHPNQLRHLVAVELRERFGLEVVRATLGHSYKATSDHYSKAADKVLAGKAAAEAG